MNMIQFSLSSYLCLWMRALKAIPSLQLVVKLWMLTFGYLEEEITARQMLT